VDELHINIAPVLLGQGTRLFDNLPDGMVELERFRVLDSADATHLSFRINRDRENDNDTDSATATATNSATDSASVSQEG
jgi:hypothetical protein